MCLKNSTQDYKRQRSPVLALLLISSVTLKNYVASLNLFSFWLMIDKGLDELPIFSARENHLGSLLKPQFLDFTKRSSFAAGLGWSPRIFFSLGMFYSDGSSPWATLSKTPGIGQCFLNREWWPTSESRNQFSRLWKDLKNEKEEKISEILWSKDKWNKEDTIYISGIAAPHSWESRRLLCLLSDSWLECLNGTCGINLFPGALIISRRWIYLG